MANPGHLEILEQGVKVWNQWRKDNPDIRPDLRIAGLSRVYLGWFNLTGANLDEADLRKAYIAGSKLSWADLGWVNLNGADLSEANLVFANLTQSNLSEATLSLADLSRANIIDVKLQRTDLNRCSVGWTTFGDADLSGAIGLES